MKRNNVPSIDFYKRWWRCRGCGRIHYYLPGSEKCLACGSKLVRKEKK